jgi:hypothetical protein
MPSRATRARLCRDRNDRIPFCRRRKQLSRNDLTSIAFCRQKSLRRHLTTKRQKAKPWEGEAPAESPLESERLVSSNFDSRYLSYHQASKILSRQKRHNAILSSAQTMKWERLRARLHSVAKNRSGVVRRQATQSSEGGMISTILRRDHAARKGEERTTRRRSQPSLTFVRLCALRALVVRLLAAPAGR